MLMFLYADTPVHLGAGVSLGGVDLPIQRERHTGYPMAQGSGIKGAVRHRLATIGRSPNDPNYGRKLGWVFGPDGTDEGRPQDHAGAAAFGDGKLLLFPVRSLFGTFAYCTSALALGRLRRDLELVGFKVDFKVPPSPSEGQALVADTRTSAVVHENTAVLEDFDVRVDSCPDTAKIASWIATNALPSDPSFEYFKIRIPTHLLLLDDNLFAHLTRLATGVEPHLKINDDTGTASEGAFFYAEHLPPDALLWCLVGVGRPRAKPEEKSDLQSLGLADESGVSTFLHGQLDGKAVQVGAEATTGRGLVHVRIPMGGKK